MVLQDEAGLLDRLQGDENINENGAKVVDGL